MRRALACGLAVVLAACAHANPAVEALNAQLLSNPSATATLERWCADRRLAAEPRIVARRSAVQKPASPEVRAELQVSAAEPVRYRQVQLVCGKRVLSDADNWYVPARLTPEMNRQLDESDTPFGRVVAALNFTRRTLSARVERRGSHVLEHRAVLSTASGARFSYLVERYTSQVLAAPVAP